MGFGVVNKLLVEVAHNHALHAAPTPPISPASLLHANPNTQGTMPSPTAGPPTASTTSFAFLQPVHASQGPPFANQRACAAECGCGGAMEQVTRWTDGVSSLHFGGHGFLVPRDGGATPRGGADGHLAMVWVSGAHALALEGVDASQLAADIQEVWSMPVCFSHNNRVV